MHEDNPAQLKTAGAKALAATSRSACRRLLASITLGSLTLAMSLEQWIAGPTIPYINLNIK
jgi:hypothetical protein